MRVTKTSIKAKKTAIKYAIKVTKTGRTNKNKKHIKYGDPECPRAVFNKGTVVPGKDPDMWRTDGMGKLIMFICLCSITSKYAWNIDHIIPRTKDGSDDLDNLQPLNRFDNIRFSDRLTKDKPGYSPRKHHNAILEKRGLLPSKQKKLNLCVGDLVFARQYPAGEFRNQAEIINIDKKNDIVEVYWIDGKYYEELLYDAYYFDV
jgi:5-methylcytosine-specific restriction endonuclease McrA